MIEIKNQLTDADLIANFVKGDSEALGILLEKYRSKIYNYILMLVKDRNIADDIYQDVFIKISTFLKDGRYTDDGRFVHWVLRISHNKVIDHFRLQKNQRTVSTDDEGKPNIVESTATDNNIESTIIKQQLEIDVRKLVDSLPLEQREVVILRHYLNMPFKDIAEQTGVSINTALGRMRYALINLRKLIEDNNLNFEMA